MRYRNGLERSGSTLSLNLGAEARDVVKIEEAEYNAARRSMRMWPVPEGDENAEKAARDFMTNVLDVPRITVAKIRIEFMRRVSTTRRSRIAEEVLVRFMDVGDRDVIQSYAPNLSNHGGKAGIRLEIPTHLRHTFRILDNHSSESKKRHNGAKRLIKFEDSTKSLVLDMKISDEEGCIRIDAETARMAGKEIGFGGGNIGRATPGGKVGRRALLLFSPDERNAFSQNQSGWSQSRRSSESDTGARLWGGSSTRE